MKRVVLISVLSLLDIHLSGASIPEFHNPISINYNNELDVIPKSILHTNLLTAYNMWYKTIYYLTPLKSKSGNSPNTNALIPPTALLLEQGRFKTVIQNISTKRKRDDKYKPNCFKPTSIQIKVPP